MTKVGFFSFPRAFYVINGIELLERGAFYSMNAVLAVFMATTLALPAEQVGLIASLLFLLLYTIPLLGAALAEKFGYKAALIASFAFLAAGYAGTLFATGFSSILLAVIGIGVGAGIFKPIAAAAVSQTSTEEQRNYAFMIYYGAINLGAVVFPLAVGLVGVFAPDLLATTAFAVATVLAVLNLVLCATVWKNLRAPQKDVSVVRSFASLGDVFRNPKFLILLVIYSGFWFLYAMSLSFVAVYMVEFSRMPAWFNPALMNVINPLVIVVLAPFLAGITKPFSSIQLMIAGISLYVVGFIVLGFTAASAFFVGGILLYSIGEVLTHPSFLSYVTKIAPPDKVSVYLGYGFLPIAVGLFFGAGVGGVLYGRFAQQQGQPAIFWAIMSGVALLTVAALLIYNRFITPKAPEAQQKKRGIVGAAGTLGLAVLALLMIPALIVAASAVPGAQPVQAAGTTDDGALNAADLVTLQLAEQTGDAVEGADPVALTFTLPDTATGEAVFTLTWTDEPASTPLHTNAPDTFKLHIMLPDGTTVVESEEESSGTLELAIPNAGPGVYTVHVELVNAGDSAAASTPLIPIAPEADDGNAFTLGASHQATA
jgi:dipeptide/tripeptide permease